MPLAFETVLAGEGADVATGARVSVTCEKEEGKKRRVRRRGKFGRGMLRRHEMLLQRPIAYGGV
jgi:hypothetical protein